MAMFPDDERILRVFFQQQEYERERLRLQRIWHPELFNRKKDAYWPEPSWSTLIRREELSKMGWSESRYQEVLKLERMTKDVLEELGRQHFLWEHFERIKGLGPYLCAAFIAVGSDIQMWGRVEKFWKSLGLDIGPDGKAPRRVRGVKRAAKPDERLIPAMPHVTKIGEQFRSQFVRSRGSKLRGFYDRFKARDAERHPEWTKIHLHKSTLRKTQKLLYSCLWREWRLGYGLPAPESYAFEILHHDPDHLIRIEHFYQDVPEVAVA